MVAGSATSSTPGTAGVAADPLVWESFFWGLLSAISLNIGSAIGVTCLPTQRVRAVLMSFGGGALLFALSIELFGSVLHSSEGRKSTAMVWAMEGSAVVGGLFFALLNHLLNVLGADVRKPSTKKGRFARLRALLLRRLTLRLSKITFFSVLSLREIGDLIQSAMYKERFGTGDIIMSSEAHDSGIFFILSGMVRLQIFGKDKEGPSPIFGAADASPVLKDTPSWSEPDRDVLDAWDLGPNQIFGDMTVLCGSYLQAQAIALEPTKVLVLPGHEVARLIQEKGNVRDQISLRAVERLRQVAELRHLPDHALASLSSRCALVRYQPGDIIFQGAVSETTPVICLVLGSTERRYKDGGNRRILHASKLLCTEHLKTGQCSKEFSLVALEPTSVLIINRTDINAAIKDCMWRTDSKDGMCLDKVPSDAPFVPQLPGQLPGQVTLPELRLESPPAQQDLRVVAADVSDAEAATEEQSGAKSAPTPPKLPPQRMPSVLSSDCSGSVAEARKDKERAASAGSTRSFLGHRGSLSSEGPRERLHHLGHNLGWDEPVAAEEAEDGQLGKFARLGSAQMGQVTDLELEEHELDLAETLAETTREKGRSASKSSATTGAEADAVVRLPSLQRLSRGSPDPANLEAAALAKGDDAGNAATEGGAHAHAGAQRAVMIWLGILIDAVPESLVIGILINKAAGAEAEDRFSQSAASALPFVIGVFLSNLPESMSSSGSMKLHGMRVTTILLMWLATTVLTACGACLGAVLFPPGSSGDESAELVVVSVEGLAAGAMLTMIAQTMMPEAFEQGGDIVGLSCLAGFLCALSVRLIPMGQS